MSFGKTMHSFFTSTLPSLAAIYLVALAGIYCFQRSLMYFPPSHVYVTPQEAHADPALRELTVRTEDGLDLKGWYAPATSKPLTLVFFHGNGDELSTVAEIAAPYISSGYGFLLAEYRGYSGMPGKPTESGLYADARAYLKYLTAAGIREENIVPFGFSLGTGVATQMATEFHVGGLILLAPYLSVAKVAQVRFFIFPAQYLTKDRFENFKKVPDLHIPILIANGADDRVIPPLQGKQLFALANEPKQSYFSLAGGHIDMFDNGFGDISLKWLDRLVEEREDGPRKIE